MTSATDECERASPNITLPAPSRPLVELLEHLRTFLEMRDRFPTIMLVPVERALPAQAVTLNSALLSPQLSCTPAHLHYTFFARARRAGLATLSFSGRHIAMVSWTAKRRVGHWMISILYEPPHQQQKDFPPQE
jgi:hypothetical protein